MLVVGVGGVGFSQTHNETRTVWKFPLYKDELFLSVNSPLLIFYALYWFVQTKTVLAQIK
jgi:hypothetical protein